MNWSIKKLEPSLLAFIVLVVLQIVGILGLNTSLKTTFENISWLNMLVSFGVVIVFQPKFNSKFFAFCLLAFLIGMVVEVIGVRTGALFGEYYYTPLFGWQVLGVPIIIGLNWVLLAYCCGMAVHHRISNRWLAIVLAASIMALIDFLLEPFAIKHGLWVWHSNQPPLQNYAAWFAVSLVIQLLFPLMIDREYNPNAARYILLLTVFLVIDFCLTTI